MLPAAAPEGAALESFLPEVAVGDPDSDVQRRAALASTLLAGLELEREGSAVMRQDGTFAPVRVTPARKACVSHPGVEVASETRG